MGDTMTSDRDLNGGYREDAFSSRIPDAQVTIWFCRLELSSHREKFG